MREVKFRWWNGEQMITGKNLCVLAKNLTYPEHMQYTGLKDKNGVEIYEGDIIDSERFWGEVCFSADNLCYLIKNKLSIGAGTGFGRHQIELYNMVVEGNIYQNPELLEGGDS